MNRVQMCCVFFLCATMVVIAACSPSEKPSAGNALPVIAADAIQKAVPVQITAIGSVEAFQTISVRSQITAQIAKVLFKEGQDVKKGDLLLSLDCRAYEASVAQSQATLVKDRALAQYANDQSRRYADLIKKDYVTREQYEQIQSTAAALEATVKADEAAVESNEVQMQYCSIHSPIDGRTGMLKVNQGNLVKADDTEILTINQIQPIHVTFAVPEKDLPRLKKYSLDKRPEVQAQIPGENRPEIGTLTFIDNAIDKATGTITLRGTFTNEAKRLMPGQFVNVILILAIEPNAIVVPSQSVEQSQEGPYVYVIKQDMTAEMRPITVGEDFGGETVITKGLNAGERVVTDGQMRLIPGAKVIVKSSK